MGLLPQIPFKLGVSGRLFTALVLFGSAFFFSVCTTVEAQSNDNQPATNALEHRVGASWFLIVSGIGGEPHYSTRFKRWSRSFADVVAQYRDVGPEHVIRLAENSEQSASDAPVNNPHKSTTDEDVVVVDEVSTRENILKSLDAIRVLAAPGDTVVMILIGHGSTDGERILFNTPGPDLSTADLATALNALADQQIVLINTTTSSSGFVEQLAQPNRVIISATSNPAENQHTYFGQYFIAALASESADRNKDDRVSILEAFIEATKETKRHYDDKGNIPTEHALLDDDGDGIGTHEPRLDATTSDSEGLLAARIHLHEGPLAGEQASRASLRLDIAVRALVDEVESLKRVRTSLSGEEFDDRLESILLNIAKNRRDRRSALNASEAHSD